MSAEAEGVDTPTVVAAFVGYALVVLPIMLAPRMVEACVVAALMIGFVGPGVRFGLL